MLNVLPRFRGVDVPTFEIDPAEILSTHTQWQHAAEDPELLSFVREVDFSPYWLMFGSLKEVLDHTDTELDRASEEFGATTVPHQWGLIATDSRYYPTSGHYNMRRFVPAGMALAAQVDCLMTIDYIEPSPHGSLRRFNSQPGRRFRNGLRDIHEGQFTLGINKNTVLREPGWHLHDIEPRYRRQPRYT